MNFSGRDLRIDLAMRQYVRRIIEYLAQGGDIANARMNMIENGVPAHVQARVLEGKAALN
ncbi:MAG TPA: hypothetical protein PK725_09725 [Rhodocyclaceae bacterium]|jgi:hypothetical protein|nr:hypothetical protein [Rhodocyclaceae bacterium]HRQ47217.1 hypothetical protein [Rhodocyclaceae bacterium]